MELLLKISFRNLLRQKRRNLLLGGAFAISAAALILSTAFANGISKTLIERVVAYATGHANVMFAYKGKPTSQVMRDGAPWKDRIETIPGVVKVEPSMGTMARAIGNGRSDNVLLTSVNMHAAFSREDSSQAADNFPMREGGWEALKDTTIENPLVISSPKAKFLKVGIGDKLRVRLQDIDGTFQAARLTVVGIFDPSNMFLDGSLFLELRDMRRIMGLREEDSPSLYLTIRDPQRNAATIADSLWNLLKPSKAFFAGSLTHAAGHPSRAAAVMGGLLADTASRRAFARFLSAAGGGSGGESRGESGFKGVYVSAPLSASLGVKTGDTVTLAYPPRVAVQAADTVRKAGLAVAGVFEAAPDLPRNLALIAGRAFYDHYDEAVPMESPESALASGPWQSVLSPEWMLLPQARSAAEFQKQQRDLSQGRYRAPVVSVNTMYAAASDVLQLENALHLLTFAALAIVFSLILVGVVNSLRMAIREKTREIGTLRAIGMQRRDIRRIFVLEMGLLALLSSGIGTVVGLALMAALSSIPLDFAGNPMGILLHRGRLVFAPTLSGILAVNGLITLVSVIMAWFPAGRAAKIPASSAMRHH